MSSEKFNENGQVGSTTVRVLTQAKNTDSTERPAVALVVEQYEKAVRVISETARIALPHIVRWTADEMDALQKKIQGVVPLSSDDNIVTIKLPSARKFAEFRDDLKRFDDLRAINTASVLTRSLFTQLFAEFDAFIGELLKTIYLKNDNLLKGISREISLAELLDFSDLSAVKKALLEKEIDSIRRDSYVEQFSALEKKFGITLKKFSEWSQFVELSQRRNILTHNGGVVSDQYLAVCGREGYKFSGVAPKIGDLLDVPFDYFVSASRLLSKVGLMLGYTLWNKVYPDETDSMHHELNNLLYSCLEQKRFKFVAELGDFVFSEPMRKKLVDIDYRVRIVNIAIGMKFSDNHEQAIQLLRSVDWSASYRDFRLAQAVLEDRYAEATEMMKNIGKKGEILNQDAYHSWPLFSRFRERPEFYDAYLEIYGEPFSEKLPGEQGEVQAPTVADEELPE
ncbi:hypothetical protein [Herbaspirillum rubrisubalbicans]|uniref:hypothetical protein n=1 Tax=Herbaspirillum rubrisubalbicans TaxID=80842 RepID=UPI0002F70BE7|nr:hypothetical protein [Herbaspirillum rubrisubalbicans]